MNDKRPDLTRRDWTLAALAALAEGGIEAVKVESLAARLSVSKGSFYWHFKDREELHRALLDLWQSDHTQSLIDDAAALPSPAERLRHVARAALEANTEGVDSARLEAAMQAWAAKSKVAADRLRAVDNARVDYLADELRLLGMDAAAAMWRAKAIYLALLGLFAARAYNEALADDAAFLELAEQLIAPPRSAA